MVSALFAVFLVVNGLLSIAMPWIGVLASYLVILLSPQAVWWWAFEGVQPLQWVVAPMLFGLIVLSLRGRAAWRNLATTPNALMALLLLTSSIGYFFGKYTNIDSPFKFYDAQVIYEVIYKAYIIYFAAVLILDRPRKLLLATVPLIVTVLYMTYWANDQYLSQGRFGRIGGPTSPGGVGIYNDENIFAVLFVVGFPFVYYLGLQLSSWSLRLALWAAIPLMWHAAFLTASRGALVATGAVLLTLVLRSERKSLGVLVLVAFIGAFLWQGGDVLHSRSSTISGFSEEQSALDRLDAWTAALAMIAKHPFTGVGLASFGQAYPDFSDTRPKIAHNTVLQVGAEGGVLASLAYLALFAVLLWRLNETGKILRASQDPESTRLQGLNEACFSGLVGFFVCAVFLSLEKFELFHYLVLLSNGLLVIVSRQRKAELLSGPRGGAEPARGT